MEKGLAYGFIFLGILLILLGSFFLFVWIPTDTTGIWASADSWKRILALQILIGGIIVGALFLVVCLTLLYFSSRTPLIKPSYTEPPDYPPTSLRAWSLTQFTAATILLFMNYVTWYSINILGGPSGFSHHVPLEYLLLSILIETPTLILALLTWSSPHRIHWLGWCAVGAFHFFTAIHVFFTPWVYSTHAYAASLGLYPPIEKLAEFLWGGVILGGTLILTPTFMKLKTKDTSPTHKTYGLTVALIGVFLTALSSVYILWGINYHLVTIPLLGDFPVYGDELETVRALMFLPSLAFVAGIALLTLGTLWYLQNNALTEFQKEGVN